MRKSQIAVVSAVAVVLLGVVALVWYLRAHTFSARARPNAIEEYVARNLRHLATDPAIRHRPNPIQPTELAIAEARDHFADHCAVCHANDGSGRTMFGAGMYPPAPDMRQPSTQGLTDGEIFSIIQNGIRFTGMPGFGGDDGENWKLVHFIRRLPRITGKELELMREINNQETETKQ